MAAIPAAKLQPTPNVLEVRNLSIRFRTPRGPVLALRNVSVAVPRGSVVGLVGESGSGKSTLALAVMRLMAGNATITEGSLDFAGRDLLALKPAEMQALRGDRLSMVFQDPMTSLNPVRAIGLQMLDIQYRERGPPRPRSGGRRRRCCAGSAFPIASASSSAIPMNSPAACASASPSPWESWSARSC